MRLIWLPGSLTDLEGISSFYSSTSENIVQDVCKDIFESVGLLTVFPLLGKIDSSTQNDCPNFRFLILPKRKIKIFYYIENEVIYIAFLWDCRRNPKDLVLKSRIAEVD